MESQQLVDNIKLRISEALKLHGVEIEDKYLDKVCVNDNVVDFSKVFDDAGIQLSEAQLKTIMSHLSENTITFKSNVGEFKRDASGSYVLHASDHYDKIAVIMQKSNSTLPDEIKKTIENYKSAGCTRYSDAMSNGTEMMIDPIDVMAETAAMKNAMKCMRASLPALQTDASPGKQKVVYSMQSGTVGMQEHVLAFIASVSENLSQMCAKNEFDPRARESILSLLINMAGINMVSATSATDKEISSMLEKSKLVNIQEQRTDQINSRVSSTKEKCIKIKSQKKDRKTIRFIESDVINRAQEILDDVSNSMIEKMGKKYCGHIKVHAIAENVDQLISVTDRLKQNGIESLVCAVGDAMPIIPDMQRVMPVSINSPRKTIDIWRETMIVQEFMGMHDAIIAAITRAGDNMSLMGLYHKIMIPVIVGHSQRMTEIMSGDLDMQRFSRGVIERLGESRVNIIKSAVSALIPSIAEGSSDMQFLVPVIETLKITNQNWLKSGDTTYSESIKYLQSHIYSMIKYVSNSNFMRQLTCANIIGVFSPHPKLYKSFMYSIQRKLFDSDLSQNNIKNLRIISSRYLESDDYAEFNHMLDKLNDNIIKSDRQQEANSAYYLSLPIKFRMETIDDNIAKSAFFEFVSNCIAGQYRAAPLAHVNELCGRMLEQPFQALRTLYNPEVPIKDKIMLIRPVLEIINVLAIIGEKQSGIDGYFLKLNADLFNIPMQWLLSIFGQKIDDNNLLEIMMAISITKSLSPDPNMFIATLKKMINQQLDHVGGRKVINMIFGYKIDDDAIKLRELIEVAKTTELGTLIDVVEKITGCRLP